MEEMNELLEDKELPEQDDDALEFEDEYCAVCGELLDDCLCDELQGE